MTRRPMGDDLGVKNTFSEHTDLQVQSLPIMRMDCVMKSRSTPYDDPHSFSDQYLKPVEVRLESWQYLIYLF